MNRKVKMNNDYLIRNGKRNHAIPNGGYYYNNDLFFSAAYQELTISSRNLLHCLISELRWTRNRRKKQFTNNGEISFTEKQFKEQFGSCSQTYLSARNQLIEVGLIKQTYRGGMCRGDMAKYKILCIEGIKLNDKRWLRFPEENWKCEIPKSKNTLVGINTRFKKGVSGRTKTKSTLKKYTHK